MSCYRLQGYLMNRRTLSLVAAAMVTSPSYAWDFSYKGMIKPELISSNAGIASYGNTYSHVAPTHALRTDFFGSAPATEQQTLFLESQATSFQAAHSRFSLNMNHGKVKTVIEFDFIDGETGFTNQTAIQAQEPRLRLATIYYDATDNLTLFGGQKWTTAAGIKSNGSYNWIGNAYRAGNSGFLAMEAGASYKNAGWTFTGALTGKGRNNSTSGINANELGGMPGVAVDVNYKFDGHMIGFAGHVAQVNFEKEPRFVTGEDQDANLFKVYSTLKFGDVSVSGEYYIGESLNNQNALGVAPATSLDSTGRVRESFGESGFFTFVSWNLRPGHNMKAGYSTASVNSEDRSRLTQTELLRNSTAYVNYGYKVTEGLTAFAQLTNFKTEYGVDNKEFSAVETRVGVVFTF